MLSPERILIDGALLSLVMSVLVFASFLVNPRIWLGDYPEAIRKLAPPLNAAEKRQRALFMIPFLLGFILIPFFSTRAFVDSLGSEATFLSAFLHAFAVLNIFNLFDAVVLDWLFLGLMHPKFALIAEAHGQKAILLDSRKLVTDWLKGVVIFCSVFGLVIGGVALVV